LLLFFLAENIYEGIYGNRYADFSTYDKDQDRYGGSMCAKRHHSGWWFKFCTDVNPNGMYTPRGTLDDKTMHYMPFRENVESLRAMKLMFK